MFKRDLLTDPRTLALTAVMTAIIFILTSIVKIPTGAGGFIHLGDIGVLFSGFAFGPVVGAIASALGTGLADISQGYAFFAPYTFVIHGLMGLAAGYIVRSNDHQWRLLIATVVCGVILVGGYFLVEVILLGVAAAGSEVLPNVAQIVVGGIGSIPLYYAVRQAYPPLIR